MPSLDLTSLAPSTSSFGQFPTAADIRAPMPTRAYTTDDPWNVSKFPVGTPAQNGGSLVNGAPSSISGTGLPKDWWRKQETVTINILGQQGFILNRYLVYEVATDVCDLCLPSRKTWTDHLFAARTTSAPTLFGVRYSVGLLGTAVSISVAPAAAA